MAVSTFHVYVNFLQMLTVLLRRQILKRQLSRQLSRQMFVSKLLIFSSLFLLSNLKVISNKCFKTKCKLRCQNNFFMKLLLKSGNTSVYILCFHYRNLSEEHMMR